MTDKDLLKLQEQLADLANSVENHVKLNLEITRKVMTRLDEIEKQMKGVSDEEESTSK